MAQKARLRITFNRDVVEDEQIQIYRVKDGGLFTSLMKSVFKPSRTQSGILPIYPATSTPGEAAAMAYENYFNVDFNSSGLMSITRNVNVINLEIDFGWEFGNYTTTTGATFEYFPEVPDTFKITSVNFVESSTPCDTVIVRIVTTEKTDSYMFEGFQTSTPVPVNATFFDVEINRLQPTRILLNKSGQTSLRVHDFFDEPHLYFQKLLNVNIRNRVFSHPLNGATIKVEVEYLFQLAQRPQLPTPNLEYSLNGTTWQTSPLFTGQVDGDYTVWVKDSLGCIRTKDLTISGIKNARDKYIYISDLNSVGFSESEIWDGKQNGVEKNNENTLAETDRQEFLYDEKVIYRQEDKIRIQFKSNYDYHNIIIEGCKQTTSYEPFIQKMSNNLDKYESLDAKMYSYGDGSQTAVFFDSGTVYNRFDIPIGSYELSGNLPDFAVAGNYVELIGTNQSGRLVLPIRDVFYDSEIGKNILIFDFDCDSVYPVDIRTIAIYDLLPYEVYEFEVDFNSLVNGMVNTVPRFGAINDFRIRIKCTDDLYEERNFYSNWIEIIKTNDSYDLNKYFAIHYSNNNNRSIFYNYGIKHFIRAEVESSNTIIDDSIEIVKGDSSTYLSESVVNHGINIKFAPVTHKVLMKLVLAISSENLFINGLGYVKSGAVETEPIENTNLHSLTCTLLRNSQNFNTFANGNAGDSEGYTTLYIPQLITTNLGGSLKV